MEVRSLYLAKLVTMVMLAVRQLLDFMVVHVNALRLFVIQPWLLVFMQLNVEAIRFPCFVAFPLGFQGLMVSHPDLTNLGVGFRMDYLRLLLHFQFLALNLQMGY